jgi:hypothetical protein
VADDAQSTDSDVLGAAADRIRETAKWLITTFAAVAAVLVAGSQLSNIGHLSFWRFLLALLAVLVGLAGVAWAINEAAKVLTAGRVSLGELADTNNAITADLRTRVNNDPALLGGYSNVSDLKDEYTAAQQKQKQVYDVYYQDINDDAKRRATDVADAQVQQADNAVQRLLSVTSFESLSSTFDGARKQMFFAALVAAAGIVGFAAAAHPKEKKEAKETPTVAAPSEVTIKLSKDGKKLLANQLGKDCPLDAIPAVVVKFDGDTANVVTLPSQGCRVARFTVPAKIGTLAPR